MKQGYLGYEEWVVIEDFNISTVKSMRRMLMKETSDMIKELEKYKKQNITC